MDFEPAIFLKKINLSNYISLKTSFPFDSYKHIGSCMSKEIKCTGLKFFSVKM